MKATRTKYDRTAALSLLSDVQELYVAKGRSLLHYRRSDDWPDDDTLADLILGRSGTLRAPVIRSGPTMIVGFHPDAYQAVLGD